MDPDQIVCNCMSVTVGMIKDAFDSGAETLEAIQAATFADTVCNMCEEDVISVLNALKAEKYGEES